MATPRFQPVGPINQGQSVLLGAIINNQPYIAIYDSGLKDAIFNLLPRPVGNGINPILTTTNLLVLQYQGVIGRGVFVDTARQSQLLPYFNSGSPYLSLQIEGSASLPSMVTDYALPPAPAVLWSGAAYEVRGAPDTGGEVVVGVRYRELTNGTIRFAAARIIPIYFNYIASSGSGSTQTCSTANASSLKAAEVFFCSWVQVTSNTAQGSYCISQNVPSVTWTNPGDCSSNFNYNYCPTGSTCGQVARCYAECLNGGDCVVRSGKLVCSGGSGGGGSGGGTQPLAPVAPRRIEPFPLIDKPWYKSTWFIIAVIALIIFTMFVVYLYVRTSDTALVANQEYASQNFAPSTR